MKTSQNYTGPLSGLTVLDFGWYFAGPMVGMLLADQGATVIRIVKPVEKELPSQQYRLLNRNKKLLELDLKSDEGKAQALELITKADVLIENFRPGVMKRLGLDYASVKEANPGLVYLSLPGFASNDTERALLQAWEGVVSAAAGIYKHAQWFRQTLGFPPVYTSVPLCSTFAAIHGAIAVSAALVARAEHGSGALLEAPLFDAGMAIFSSSYFFLDPDTETALPEAMQPFSYQPEDDDDTRLRKLRGAAEVAMNHYVYSLYEAGDGRKVMIHVADRKHFVERYFKALGIADQLKAEGFVSEGPWDKEGKGNNVSNGHGLSLENLARVRELINEALKARPAAEWEEIMAEVGVPCGMVRSREEWLALDPLFKAGLFTEQGGGDLSTIRVPGRLVDMAGPENSLADIIADDPAPLNGQSFDRANGAPKQANLRDQKKSDLLKGLKVLDLANIVAGPEASCMLAQYGATVIRSEGADPGFNHPQLITMTLDVAQGKQSIVLDLKEKEGRQVFETLVKWADIVLHNVLDNTTERMGISHSQLQAINPNIVSCQLSCSGSTYRGGWENRPGFDPIAQMPSGIPAHFGTLEQPQGHGGISIDIMGGLSLAFCGLTGLYQQRTTGYGGEGRASLIRAANYVQLPLVISENGECRWSGPGGQNAKGPHPWQRLYECSDGWIFVGTRESRYPSLCNIVAGGPGADETSLEAAFAGKSCEHWIEVLRRADIGCHVVLSNLEILKQAHILDVENDTADEEAAALPEFIRWSKHPSGRPIIVPAPSCVRVGEKHSYLRLSPAPRIGAQTRDVLAELGYSAGEIDKMIETKAAHDYLPVLGSKDAYFHKV